jgi:hypothetical protein
MAAFDHLDEELRPPDKDRFPAPEELELPEAGKAGRPGDESASHRTFLAGIRHNRAAGTFEVRLLPARVVRCGRGCGSGAKSFRPPHPGA